MKTIKIAADFSRFPAGRFRKDGAFSGQVFREDFLLPALRSDAVEVQLDGVRGYSNSFLEEAFGGLVRENGFSANDLCKRLTIVSSNQSWVDEVFLYISEAKAEAKAV